VALDDFSEMPLAESLHLDEVFLESAKLLFAAFRGSVVAAPVEKGYLFLFNHGSVRHFFGFTVEDFRLTTREGLRSDQFKRVTVLLGLDFGQ
jgi:hypothetical protein